MPAGCRMPSLGNAAWKARYNLMRPGNTAAAIVPAGFRTATPGAPPGCGGAAPKPPLATTSGRVGTLEDRKQAQKHCNNRCEMSSCARSPSKLAASLSGAAMASTNGTHCVTRGPSKFCTNACCCSKFCAAVDAATRASHNECCSSGMQLSNAAALSTSACSTGRMALGAAFETATQLTSAFLRSSESPASTMRKRWLNKSTTSCLSELCETSAQASKAPPTLVRNSNRRVSCAAEGAFVCKTRTSNARQASSACCPLATRRLATVHSSSVRAAS
mmetsp:Transcript_22971/g.66512  ORF Transcript_22971/g.66512 Transcript_22971/m.66512 type:complete len:275 (-) Transcript_22971:1455-2279(-)